jgi:hypothetical protein
MFFTWIHARLNQRLCDKNLCLTPLLTGIDPVCYVYSYYILFCKEPLLEEPIAGVFIRFANCCVQPTDEELNVSTLSQHEMSSLSSPDFDWFILSLSDSATCLWMHIMTHCLRILVYADDVEQFSEDGRTTFFRNIREVTYQIINFIVMTVRSAVRICRGVYGLCWLFSVV